MKNLFYSLLTIFCFASNLSARAVVLFDDDFGTFSLGTRWAAGNEGVPTQLSATTSGGRTALSISNPTTASGDFSGRFIEMTQPVDVAGSPEIFVDVKFKLVAGEKSSLDFGIYNGTHYNDSSSTAALRFYILGYEGMAMKWDGGRAGVAGYFVSGKVTDTPAQFDHWYRVRLTLNGQSIKVDIYDDESNSATPLGSQTTTNGTLAHFGRNLRLYLRQTNGSPGPSALVDDVKFTGTHNVNPAPTITLQPKDLRKSLRSKATFTALADYSGTPHYQWYRVPFSDPTSSGTAIVGATQPTLEVIPTTDADYAQYYLRVTDSQGRSAESDRAQLTRTALVMAPRIRPKSQNFADSLHITITSVTPGAKIYYTLDGTRPDERSLEYDPDNGLTILRSAKLVAIATKPGFARKDSSENYTKVSSDDDAFPGVDLGTVDGERIIRNEQLFPISEVAGTKFPADYLDYATFTLAAPQRVHISVSGVDPHAKITAAVLNGAGTTIAAPQVVANGSANFDGLSFYKANGEFVDAEINYAPQPPFLPLGLDLAAGRYCIRVGFTNPTAKNVRTNYRLTISAGPDWGIVACEKGRQKGELIHVGLFHYSAVGDLPIQDNTPSWLVSHGRVNNAFSPSIFKLASALDGADATALQILGVDWETGANDNYQKTPVPLADLVGSKIGIQGADWIEPVSSFVAQRLRAHNIIGQNLSLTGHSWGSYVCGHIARLLMNDGRGSVKRFVALDPAAFGGGVFQSSQLAFSDIASWSWAFLGVGGAKLTLAGDERVASLKADDSFVVLNQFRITPVASVVPIHSSPVEVWANMLEQGKAGAVSGIAAKFQPSKIGPNNWVKNQFSFVFTNTLNFAVSRPTTKSSSTYDKTYPWEGILQVNDDFQPLNLLPSP